MSQLRDDPNAPSFSRRPVGMALATGALIVSFYLLRRHWGHVLGYCPYLLMLSCPLMYGHAHGGHGKHPQTSGHANNDKE